MNHTLLLMCAGSGQRFGGVDKTLFEVADRPLFLHSLETFLESALFSSIRIIYRDEAQRAVFQELLSEKSATPLYYTQGGGSRQESVANGLAALEDAVHYVWTHDGARPLIRAEMLPELKCAVETYGAAVLCHRVIDTIKRAHWTPRETRLAQLEDLDRSGLWAMETPQCFERGLIERAYKRSSRVITDDTAAVSALGHPVFLVENRYPNPKLTRVGDEHHIASLSASFGCCAR